MPGPSLEEGPARQADRSRFRQSIRGAVAILFMILGYKLGTVQFVAVAAAKDEAPGAAKWAWSGPVF